MKGVVNQDLNERQLSPSVNAPISAFYQPGDVVEIDEMVQGDLFDGDNLWYRLSNGGYVWNGAVDAEVDGSGLSAEDKDQYLICYREVQQDGRPDLDSKQVPAQLYFTPVRLPAAQESIRVNNLIPGPFVHGFMRTLREMSRQRQHVFVYIHGFQLCSSLNLDLFLQFVKNYMNHADNNIAKVLFMSWPSQGLSRKKVDDRAMLDGQRFTANNLFETFRLLSEALALEGKFLNLMVHSFGHQLLNGMLNAQDLADPNDTNDPNYFKNLPKGIFENIFLMAPDVTHLAVQHGGATLDNVFGSRDTFHYGYAKLTHLGNKVHVFHDKYDYLLYSSTRQFVGKRNINDPVISRKYRSLGNYGAMQLPPVPPASGLKSFIDIQTLISDFDNEPTCDFPFQKMERTPFAKEMDRLLRSENYDEIKILKLLFNKKLFQNRHRYLFTCKPVVEKVLKLLS